MNSLAIFSTWSLGIINGYKSKENGISNSIKYGSIATTSAILIGGMVGDSKTFSKSPVIALGIFIMSAPIFIGSIFCTGNFLGKGIRDLQNE